MSKGGAKWMKQLKHEISKSFKKIRLSTGKGKKLDTNLSVLFSLRESLIIKISNSSLNKDEISNLKAKLKETDDKIADYKAEENFKTVNENIKHLVDDTENLKLHKNVAA